MSEASSPYRRIMMVIALLFVLAVGVWGTTWQSDVHIHTILEVIATVLAAVVGSLALVRFYSKKSNRFLFIGTGFMATAFFDGYHAIVTSEWFYRDFPSDLAELIPWSWLVSRLFLAILLWLSVMARESHDEPPQKRNEVMVYLVVSLLALLFFLFFTQGPLPQAYLNEWFLHRPMELIPALFFLLALRSYYRSGNWRHDVFCQWVLLALVVSLAVQTLLMPFSKELYDHMFDLAHLLKIISYVLVFVGLASSMSELVQQVKQASHSLHEVNRQLQDEISERKQIEEQLHGLTTRLAQAQQLAHLGSWDWHVPSGKVTWSDELYRIIGLEVQSSDITIETFMQYIDPDNQQMVKNTLAQTLQDQEPLLSHLRIIRPDGQIRILHVRGNVISSESQEPVRIWGTAQDVTESFMAKKALQKSTAKLEASNRELQEFAYIASHDLQEPLRKINAFGDRLSSKYADSLPSQAQDYLRRMQNAATRMQQLIEDLLALSRITTRGRPFVEVDLMKVVNEVIDDLETTISESNGQVDVAPLPTIVADRTQMRQLFQNTIANALKFSRKGVPPVVKVASRSLVDDENRVSQIEITIQDNGIGFKEKYLDRIFQPFQRLHGRTKYAGTGMGLAICRKIVERHNGSITATSVPEEGTTMIITLPAHELFGQDPTKEKSDE